MEKSKLIRALSWTWKRLPLNSVYYYLQGEFAPTEMEARLKYSRNLGKAVSHVAYAFTVPIMATILIGKPTTPDFIQAQEFDHRSQNQTYIEQSK